MKCCTRCPFPSDWQYFASGNHFILLGHLHVKAALKKVDLHWSTETLFQYSLGSFSNNYGDGDNHGNKGIDLISKTTTQIEQEGIRKKKLEAAQIHFLFDVFAAVAIVKC